MPRLYLITVPGLDVTRHWLPVHDRLHDDFPQVIDVLATTIAETLLIVYEGETDIDAWLTSVSEGVLSYELHARRASRRSRATEPAAARGPGAGETGAKRWATKTK